MHQNDIYWVWIQQSIGYNKSIAKEVLSLFNTAKDFYKAGEKEWRMCAFLSAKDIDSLNLTSIELAGEIIRNCEQLGIKIITIENPVFPEKLKNIYNPPCLLYFKGELPDFNNKLCIAIVGTRSATPYGKEMAFKFGFELAAKGVIIISGMAVGVDGISQRAAIKAQGKTVAVLGSGLNFSYLKIQSDLRSLIPQNGALVSEFAPDFPAARWTFPARNRIISGLCDGVLVIEAGVKSGSLITANFALEQNREVFAIPGDIRSSVSKGTNRLIKACAKPVLCLEDILEEYYLRFPEFLLEEENKTEAIKEKKKESTDLEDKVEKFSPNAQKIFKIVGENFIHIDEITVKANIAYNLVSQAILELELNGFIESGSGRRYKRVAY